MRLREGGLQPLGGEAAVPNDLTCPKALRFGVYYFRARTVPPMSWSRGDRDERVRAEVRSSSHRRSSGCLPRRSGRCIPKPQTSRIEEGCCPGEEIRRG